MKAFNFKNRSTLGFGNLLEKVEILRSRLRWAKLKDSRERETLISQCNVVRDAILQLSHKERLDNVQILDEPIERKTAQQRKQDLLDRNFVFEGVFGENQRLLATLEIAEKAAPSMLPVLIDGESGTGKELMAKIIHANSHIADKAFISVNCGAIPENLIESELFGHKKGAFTGAASDRKGKFESAHNGTIFLDEIGELPLSGQVKLLRVLQSKEIQRVGSDDIIYVDARVVAATNRNLLEMCQQGGFREDLYYRLSVIQIGLPALRERRDEMTLLCDYFCDEAAEELTRAPVKLSPRLTRFLGEYAYPGNIRELRNIIFRVSCLASAVADIVHLPDNIRPQGAGLQLIDHSKLWETSLAEIKKSASDAAEKQYLKQGLTEMEGKVSDLAKKMDMNRSHLQTILKKHGIRSKAFRNGAVDADVFELSDL